ncbi:MAG: glycosyltransferase family 4 protein [Nitrososphaerales archaeon]|nr:glycosyltransferase family 4 protein [Nitrososphaerales archaeon]
MRDRPRVAMLTRDYPPTVGGIPTYAFNLVSQLKRIGVDVDVVEGRGDVKTLLLPLHWDVRLGDYDLVHVASLPYAAFVGFHPLVVTTHSPVTEEGKYYGSSNRLKRPWASFLEGRSARKANAIVAVSKATATELASRYDVGDKVHVIPNGVDTSFFAPGRRSSNKVLICSRLDPRKNIGEALAALGEVGAPLELEVVGEGPERSRLEGIASRYRYPHRFTGALPEEELRNAYATARVFVSSSSSEGFGISVLQAMAAGCAVVVSDLPAHRELVDHMANGMVYSREKELAEYVTLLLKNDDLAEKLGARAREKAKQYSWESVATRTKELYLSLLSRSSHSGD